MKKRLAILFSAAIALTSCGTAARYASSEQRYPDGIYYSRNDNTSAVQAETEDISQLVSETQQTQLLLFGDRKDTLVIPENKSAVIKFNGTAGTTVAITDDPFTDCYYNSTPWEYYRPVVYTSWAWDPWYYGRYWGYYDSWYWSRWYYDPWYWGYSSIWWDPWFYNPYFWGAPRLPYHPHVHHHHDIMHGPAGGGPDRYYGHRTSSGSSVRRTYASRNGSSTSVSGTSTVRRGSSSSVQSSVRTGVSRGNTATRATASSGVTAVRRTGGTRVSGNAATSVTGVSSATGAQSRVSSSYRRGSSYTSYAGSGLRTSSAAGSTAVRNGVLTAPETMKSASYNYRRPASSSVRTSGSYYGGNGTASGTASSYRSSAGTRSSAGFNGSSAYSRSSSSYNRSSSSSFNRSSSSSFSRSSSSSFSRSSSGVSRGSSGGGSRSGGSYRR